MNGIEPSLFQIGNLAHHHLCVIDNLRGNIRSFINCLYHLAIPPNIIFCGGSRIRTLRELSLGCFTQKYLLNSLLFQSSKQGSNLPPSDWKSDALPTMSYYCINLVGADGIEPPRRCFTDTIRNPVDTPFFQFSLFFSLRYWITISAIHYILISNF